jgi:hypothetical protein
MYENNERIMKKVALMKTMELKSSKIVEQKMLQ